MTKSTTKETDQALPVAEPIPNPPGGGSWTWDDTVRQWLPRAEQTEQSNQDQE